MRNVERKSAKMGNKIFCAKSGFPVKKVAIVAASSDQRRIISPLEVRIYSSSIKVRKMISVRYLKFVYEKKVLRFFWGFQLLSRNVPPHSNINKLEKKSFKNTKLFLF